MSDEALNQGLLPGLLGYLLRRAQQLVFTHFAESLRDLDVTPGQVGLLVLVGNNPGLSQTALARAVGVERSSLGEATDRLVRRGLVERRPSPNDRRSHALHLSSEGERFVSLLEPRIRRHESAVAKGLTAAERERLMRLLGKLVSAIEERGA